MEKVRVRRTFDLGLKLDLVKEIEQGRITVLGVSKIYGLSTTAVYKWLHKYSDIYKRQNKVVVEQKSLSDKNKELRSQIDELQSALGRKQMRVDYLERIISSANNSLGVDIEKKNKRLL